MVTVVFFFVFFPVTFLSLRSLASVSNSHLLLLFPSHSFQTFLSAVLPSHSRYSSLPFSLWASDFFASFSKPILSTLPDNFNLLLTNFFFNHFLPADLHSQFVQSSLIRSLHFHDFFLQLFSQTCTFSCCFCVSSIVSKPYIYDAGVTHEEGIFPFRL